VVYVLNHGVVRDDSGVVIRVIATRFW